METEIMDLIIEHEGCLHDISKKFYGVSKNDLIQAGILGLIKAYRNYRNDGTTKFLSYAYKYIYGEMYQFVLSSKNIKVTKDILRLYKQIEKTKEVLTQTYHKEPSVLEISLYSGIDSDIIATTTSLATEMLSLDETFKDSDVMLGEVIGKSVNYDDRILLEDSLEVLTEDEREIINKRYFDDMTQSELAKEMGMTQVMISRLEKKSLTKMRNYIAA